MTPISWRCCLVLATLGSACANGGEAVRDGRPVPSAPQIAQVKVNVSANVVLVGHPEPLTLTVTYEDGSTAPANKAVWTTDDSAVAEVDARGVLVPLANGVVTIGATIGGATGSLRLRVAPDYGGSWEGIHRIVKCEGAHCSPHSVPYVPNLPRDEPFRITLTQDGIRVSGQLVLGRKEGFVFCELSDSGSLQFDGMYDPPDLSWKEVMMREWNSRVEDNRLLGTLRYGEPDTHELSAELTSVVRR